MLEYGLWAGGALTIGLGILPVVLALASLVERRSDRTRRAGVPLVLGCAVAVLGLYTAAKAAAPLDRVRHARRGAQPDLPGAAVFVATAAWLARPRRSRSRSRQRRCSCS